MLLGSLGNSSRGPTVLVDDVACTCGSPDQRWQRSRDHGNWHADFKQVLWCTIMQTFVDFAAKFENFHFFHSKLELEMFAPVQGRQPTFGDTCNNLQEST